MLNPLGNVKGNRRVFFGVGQVVKLVVQPSKSPVSLHQLLLVLA